MQISRIKAHTKEAQKMYKEKIMLKLTDFLMKENLITAEEKLKAADVIKAVNKS